MEPIVGAQAYKSGRGGVEFVDEICFRLVREIVTFGDKQGQLVAGRARLYSIFTMFLLGSCGSRRQIRRNISPAKYATLLMPDAISNL